MASDITLSSSVRQNLLSLQSTAQLMSMTQNRLATGKKVNSALDNPASFFTSQSLNNRASDLSTLLDSINQAQQTLKAADTGITSLTKLVESAKSLAKQAQQSSAPAATYALNIAGTAIAADTNATATSTSTFTATIAAATASVQSSVAIDATDLATDWADGQTFSLTFGGVTATFESDTGTDGVGAGNIGFTDADELAAAIQSAFGDAVSVSDDGAGNITVAGNFTQSFTVGGSAAAQGTDTAAVDGDTLTINDGTNTATFRKVASGAVAADGTFSNLAELSAAVTASNLTGITAAASGSNLQISAAAGGQFTVGGTLGTDFGFAATAYEATNTTLGALAGQSLTIQVGDEDANTFTFTATTTRADLEEWVGDLELGTGVTASISGAGVLSVTSTSKEKITVNGSNAAVNTALGLTDEDGVHSPTATVPTFSDTRTTYQNQYNDLLKQIDTLASDASYNGINLLNGDELKVAFNEDGSSSLTIKGVSFDSTSLGLTALNGNEFQTNGQIDEVLTKIDAALSSLRTQASKFGSNLTTVQTRQDFTKNMVNNLQVGADALVLADTNEEGANLLALQTRQQLSTTALSLSAQADQAVLRLF
ncbi:flagellin [Pseudorhodoplanes sinuspersici]|uniref:Flagellin n=1 Tax=Pseudorhodoplanes sinuspersici TaxID=1235591 RepID=A0A1W6ZU09_9HYPH|nr:flagellin [Pseudorhodoplanes sinuspersici]ARQ00793.1 hypothetical protein CAK95_18135 [Pseudorhodoplanes sinuspersici]RKE72406.1 flagellin-like hook-associated protein FlgL [Pseudorhodoplanes sinuspersici]